MNTAKPLAVLLASLAIAFSAGGAAAQQSAPADPPVKPIRPSKIILVGDSTTAVHGGWGPSFCGYHVTSFAACLNLARGGRSTKNYRAEGSWDVALAEMKTPGYVNTWVLIQFGHNDQPGKPGRSTDLATEFPQNLRRYVAEVRATGAKPVLLTPLTRRIFKDGTLQNDLAPWAEAVRKVAAELNVPLVDLNARSAAAVQAMGTDAANRFAQVPPPPGGKGTEKTAVPAAPPVAAQNNAAVEPMGRAKLSFDYTHLGREGADYFAKMVTMELATAVPEMRPLLVP
ncbi:rhamnogalacturonan acetylesterase [Pedomonas mirosovicensis]|uniref:rhamnogalacturonan acetylesterase n=1 Tax=Pedomonas mirosovicensis TaxID=2908641 RepID=UPI00216A95D6|nr:rhamnogalacturonan acetylesterase [Pedomonas mirosovicensis]MCH8686203.1 rhamnogalacturonan acetylesterase [Pedomonas mirosovicensis]